MHLLPYCIDRGCLSGGGYVCDYVLYKSRLFLCLCAYVSACVHCANEFRNTMAQRNTLPKKGNSKPLCLISYLSKESLKVNENCISITAEKLITVNKWVASGQAVAQLRS